MPHQYADEHHEQNLPHINLPGGMHSGAMTSQLPINPLGLPKDLPYPQGTPSSQQQGNAGQYNPRRSRDGQPRHQQ